MRITTQMLNESAKKMGLPINRHSLLDYINHDSNSNSLLNVLQKDAVGTVNQSKYEEQEKASEELKAEAGKFLAEGKDSLFEKAKESGDASGIKEEIKSLAGKYNSLLSALNKAPDTLNIFYKQSMKDLADENKEALAGIGIQAAKSGNLTIDQEKLGASSAESLEQVLGKDSAFLSKLSFLASAVESNAGANLESISSSYLSNGSLVGGNFNKFDIWG